MTSCRTTTKTATDRQIAGTAITGTFADLHVSPMKVTYKLYPTKEVRRGGFDNVVNTAIQEALAQNGGGDVLVEMQVTVSKKKKLFGTKIDYVIVSGYPATYTNFRSADDETLKKKFVGQPLESGKAKKGGLLGIFK